MESGFSATVKVDPSERAAYEQLLQDFPGILRSQGYSGRTIEDYLRGIAHFGRWVSSQNIPLAQLGEATAEEFLSRHLPQCRCPAPSPRTVRRCRPALTHLFRLLRQREWIPAAPGRLSDSPLDRLLEQFATYLHQVGGLADGTVRLYLRCLREFLRTLEEHGGLNLAALTVGRVREYVAAKVAGQQPGTARSVTCSLRAFFRFAAVNGHAPALETAVPIFSRRPRSNVPKRLTEEQVGKLLASYDTRTPLGRRDRAMAVLMARLGVRAQQVSRLRLDQLDWQAGLICLENGKSRRVSSLPLLQDIGEAIAAYLQSGRPRSSAPFLFLTHSTPAGRPLSASAVRMATRRAFRRCGLPVPSYGTHVLRHTLATGLREAGATLKEIADVLDHRSVETTAVYARLDTAALLQVAMAWPKEVVS